MMTFLFFIYQVFKKLYFEKNDKVTERYYYDDGKIEKEKIFLKSNPSLATVEPITTFILPLARPLQIIFFFFWCYF